MPAIQQPLGRTGNAQHKVGIFSTSAASSSQAHLTGALQNVQHLDSDLTAVGKDEKRNEKETFHPLAYHRLKYHLSFEFGMTGVVVKGERVNAWKRGLYVVPGVKG